MHMSSPTYARTAVRTDTAAAIEAAMPLLLRYPLSYQCSRSGARANWNSRAIAARAHTHTHTKQPLSAENSSPFNVTRSLSLPLLLREYICGEFHRQLQLREWRLKRADVKPPECVVSRQCAAVALAINSVFLVSAPPCVSRFRRAFVSFTSVQSMDKVYLHRLNFHSVSKATPRRGRAEK